MRRAPLLFWPGKQAHLKPPTTHLSRDAAAVAEVEVARRRMDARMDQEKLKLDAQARATEGQIRRKEALEKERSVAKARQQGLLLQGSDTLMEALEQDRLLTMAERKPPPQAKSKPKPKLSHSQDHGAHKESRVSFGHAALTLQQALEGDGGSENSAYSHTAGGAYRPDMVRPDMVRHRATVHILNSTHNSNFIW